MARTRRAVYLLSELRLGSMIWLAVLKPHIFVLPIHVVLTTCI